MHDDDTQSDLAISFRELGALMLAADGSMQLDHTVAVAARVLSHADQVGVTLVRGLRRPSTLGATGTLALEVDRLQYACREGPCLEASTSDAVVVSDDLATESRWPTFASRAAAQLGVRSILSVRLALSGQDRAALNSTPTMPAHSTSTTWRRVRCSPRSPPWWCSRCCTAATCPT